MSHRETNVGNLSCVNLYPLARARRVTLRHRPSLVYTALLSASGYCRMCPVRLLPLPLTWGVLGSLSCTGTHDALKSFCENLFVLLDGDRSLGLLHMTGALVLAGPSSGLQLPVLLPQLLSASSHLAHTPGLLQRKDGHVGGSCLMMSFPACA